MEECIAQENGSENLKLDFYDRSRLATWTRSQSLIDTLGSCNELAGPFLVGKLMAIGQEHLGEKRRSILLMGSLDYMRHSSSSTQPRSVRRGIGTHSRNSI